MKRRCLLLHLHVKNEVKLNVFAPQVCRVLRSAVFKMTGVRSGLVESSSRRLRLKQFLHENLYLLPSPALPRVPQFSSFKKKKEKNFSVALVDAIRSRKCFPASYDGTLFRIFLFREVSSVPLFLSELKLAEPREM